MNVLLIWQSSFCFFTVPVPFSTNCWIISWSYCRAEVASKLSGSTTLSEANHNNHTANQSSYGNLPYCIAIILLCNGTVLLYHQNTANIIRTCCLLIQNVHHWRIIRLLYGIRQVGWPACLISLAAAGPGWPAKQSSFFSPSETIEITYCL